MSNIAAIIADLRANMKAAEDRIAALPADVYVIVWHNSCLRTDGKTVAMLGPEIYTSESRAYMQAECKAWNAKLPAEQEAAVCMTAAQALETIRAGNAALVAGLPQV